MNGQSFTPRLVENMNENMEFPGATGEYIEWLQESFVQVIKEQVEKDKKDPFVKREDRGKVGVKRLPYARDINTLLNRSPFLNRTPSQNIK